MAKYTIELKDIVKNHEIFPYRYPIYNEEKRYDFEEAFKRHFFFREIGFDTVDRFIHYLRDKMTTVFPYYNELMRTATIEYDIENPYKLTETYTRKADSVNKGAAFASAVERGESKTNMSGDVNRAGETKGNIKQDGSSKQDENAKTETLGSETGNTSGESNRNGSVENKANGAQEINKTGTVENSEDVHKVNKYMDTPQGLTDLTDSKYLTNMTDDKTEGATSSESTASENHTSNATENKTETEKQTQTGESSKESSETSETVRGSVGSTSSNQVNTGSERSDEHSESVGTGEYSNTNDSNNRTENVGSQNEEYVLERKGNIGVNPASYEIDMHIKTQQTLQKIYLMFFDECEDLFMQVW